VAAIRESGRQTKVLSHDNSPEIQGFLRDGSVDFTIGQDMAYQSYQALSLLFRLLAEHKLPEEDAYCPPSPILNAELI
jgi:ABC-type sugar transport system substrate-binding protein